MNKKLKKLLTIGAAVAYASSASAAIIFSDSFNYADGGLISVSGGAYVYTDSVNMPFANSTSAVASNELSLIGASKGNELNQMTLPSNFTAVDTIYVGMTLNMSDLDGNNFRDLFQFSQSGGFTRTDLNIGGAGNSNWGIEISSRNSTGVDSTTLATPITFGLNTDIRVVMSYSSTNDDSEINAWAGAPESLVEASPLLTEAVIISDAIANFQFETPRRMAGTLDDFVVATTFNEAASATVPVPEPSTYAALLGALALAFVTWRRRR